MSITYKTANYTQYRLHHKPSDSFSNMWVSVVAQCNWINLLHPIKCPDFSTVRLFVWRRSDIDWWFQSKSYWHSLHLKHGGWVEFFKDFCIIHTYHVYHIHHFSFIIHFHTWNTDTKRMNKICRCILETFLFKASAQCHWLWHFAPSLKGKA